MTPFQSTLICLIGAFWGCLTSVCVFWMRGQIESHYMVALCLACLCGIYGSLGGIIHLGPPKQGILR